jgi:hypothetical protein
VQGFFFLLDTFCDSVKVTPIATHRRYPVINQILGRATLGQPDPVVGMGATLLYMTDRYPATIFRVFTYRKCMAVEVREDEYSHIGEGYLGDFKTCVRATPKYFVFKKGVWVRLQVEDNDVEFAKKKFSTTTERGGLRIGQRDGYQDPHF